MKMLGYFKDGAYISTDMALYCLLRERGYEVPKNKMWYDDGERSLFYAVIVPSCEVVQVS